MDDMEMLYKKVEIVVVAKKVKKGRMKVVTAPVLASAQGDK